MLPTAEERRALQIDVQNLMAPFLVPGTSVPVLKALTARFRPEPGDVERVFVTEAAPMFAEAYHALWVAEPAIAAKPHHTQVLVRLATAIEIAQGLPASEAFPGAYRVLGPFLRPEPIWATWKFVAAGESIGMSYEGLVRVGERWVWLPRAPWIVQEAARLGREAT